MVNKKEVSYTSNDIELLEGLEAVRVVPGMYMGTIENFSFQMAKEIIDNAVDEYQKGYGTEIGIHIDTINNRMTVWDNGRGLPIDKFKNGSKSTMEVLLSTLHSGSNFKKGENKPHAGIHGVGSSATNALSKWFKAESVRDNKIYSIEFKKGKKSKEFISGIRGKKYPFIKNSGTVITFEPDEEILREYVDFNTEVIRENLKIRAYTNAGLKVSFSVDNEKEEVYLFEDGILNYLENLVNKPFSEPYYIKYTDKDNGDIYEIAMQYDSSSKETIKSYVNSIATSKGDHETGFKMGLTRSFIKFMTENKLFTKRTSAKDVSGEDVRSGLVAIINLKLSKFDFSGQTKDELSAPGVSGKTNSLISSSILTWSLENDKDFKSISSRIIKFAQGRISANNYKEKVGKIEGTFNLNFSNKFSPNRSDTLPEDSELFACEGDSAGGSLKNARNPVTQAVYALKGKILNTKQASLSKVISNKELDELLKILYGTNDVKSIKDWENCRFHKVLFCADADVDGKKNY